MRYFVKLLLILFVAASIILIFKMSNRINESTRPENKNPDLTQSQKNGQVVRKDTQQANISIAEETNWDLASSFPEVDFGQMPYVEILKNLMPKGYLLELLSWKMGEKNAFYTKQKQWFELPILKLDFIYPGFRKGFLVYTISNPLYNMGSDGCGGGGRDIVKTLIVPLVDAQLIKEYGKLGMGRNMKAGDVIQFHSVKLTTSKGKSQFSFSKENPFVFIQIPDDVKRGKTYQAKFDILKAVEYEKMSLKKKKELESQKLISVELPEFYFQASPNDTKDLYEDKEFFYWEKGVCTVKKVMRSEVLIPKEASGKPLCLLKRRNKEGVEELTPIALVKELPGHDISIVEDADWYDDGNKLFQFELEIASKYLFQNEASTIIISATKPDKLGQCAPMFASQLPAKDERENISLMVSLFEGDFWAIVKPLEGPLKDYWVAPLKTAKGLKQTMTVMEKGQVGR